MGKSTISMAIFNSYVSLPEGTILARLYCKIRIGVGLDFGSRNYAVPWNPQRSVDKSCWKLDMHCKPMSWCLKSAVNSYLFSRIGDTYSQLVNVPEFYFWNMNTFGIWISNFVMFELIHLFNFQSKMTKIKPNMTFLGHRKKVTPILWQTFCQRAGHHKSYGWLHKMVVASKWRFPKMEVPQNGWLIMENPAKLLSSILHDLGVSLF